MQFETIFCRTVNNGIDSFLQFISFDRSDFGHCELFLVETLNAILQKLFLRPRRNERLRLHETSTSIEKSALVAAACSEHDFFAEA